MPISTDYSDCATYRRNDGFQFRLMNPQNCTLVVQHLYTSYAGIDYFDDFTFLTGKVNDAEQCFEQITFR